MAEFNPRQQTADAPQYVSSSRGLDYQGNKSRGMLLDGLSKAFEGLVRGADEEIQNNIRKDVQKGYDDVNAEFGVDANTLLETSITNPDGTPGPKVMPEAVQRAGDHIGDLQAAYNRGALTEKNYWMRLNSITRQLRGKYPGYRTEIDKIVAEVTGSRPANELRQDIFKEMKANATLKDKEVDEFKKWREYAIKQGIIRGEQLNQFLTVDTLPALQARIANFESDQADIKRAQAELTLRKSQQTLRIEDVEVKAQAELSALTQRALADGQDAIGQTNAAINQSLQELFRNPASLTPERRNQLIGQVHQLETSMRRMLEEAVDRPWDGKDLTATYRAQLGPEKTKQMIEAAMSRVALLKQALGGQQINAGLLQAVSQDIEAQKDKSAQQVMKDLPWTKELGGLNQVAGPQVTSLLLGILQSSGMTAISSSLVTYFNAKNFQADISNPNRPTFAQDAQDAKNRGATKDFYDGMVKSLGEIVKNPQVPDEYKAKAVAYYFDPRNAELWSKMDPASRQQLYTQLTTPEIYSHIKKLEGSNPQVVQMYRSWTLNLTQELSRELISNMKQYNFDRRQQMIVYNPDTNQLQWVDNPNARTRDLAEKVREEIVTPLTGVGSPAYQRYQANSSLQQLNTLLRHIQPIIVDQNQSVPEQMQRLFKSLQAPTEGGHTMSDLVTEALTQAVPPNPRGGEGDRTQRPFEAGPVNLFDQSQYFQPRFIEPVTGRFVLPGPQAAPQEQLTFPTQQEKLSQQQAPQPQRQASLSPDNSALNLSDDEKLPVPNAVLAFQTPRGQTIQQIVEEATKQGKVSTYALAEAFTGSNERDLAANKTLTSFFKQFGGQKLNPAQTAWCAAFVNAVLGATGDQGTGRLNAKSFLNWGYAPDTPRKGDIVVLSRGNPNSWQGHVGFFDGYDEQGNVRVLGGNQDNSVNVKTFPKSQVLGIRRSVRLSEMKPKDQQMLAEITGGETANG